MTLSSKDIEKILYRHGFVLSRQKGSHPCLPAGRSSLSDSFMVRKEESQLLPIRKVLRLELLRA